MSATITYTEKESHPGKIVNYQLQDNYCEFFGENDLILRIYFINEHILRFRYAIEGYFENDFSYAIDPKFEQTDVKVRLEESIDYIFLYTEHLTCRVAKEHFSIAVLDSKGILLNEDEKGFHWEKNEAHGGYIVQMTKRIQAGEAFYGLGDKPVDFNLRGGRFQNWGTDEYGYQRGADPLYKNIPFYYGLHDGRGYGIFFDNSFRSYFDFGKERANVMSFWAQGGEMNYYFVAGPQLLDVCERYTRLTGTPDMPPMWALGFQQCKWSYYPESQVREIATKFRELQIPCDAIYLDIDYMDGFRCFTWDKEKFPDPKGMVADLKADGFQTMVIIDPGIKKDKNYPIFTEALEKGYFCRHTDGPFVEGKVWPGECYFPDFTRPEVRDWWADLYQELIEEIGIAGVWNDMNEPAVFEVENKTFPDNVVFDYDGNQTSHRKAHNVYGMQMARATAKGVKKYRNGKRTLIITRSGYSGLQRYTSVWTGDNIATWEHLWLAGVQAQRLAVSGISFAGSDIGGFIEQPTAELMVRWIQLGIFHPFCRVHSSGDHGDQEPWSFSEECTHLFKRFVELRYQLLPYIYTAFYRYHKEGTPMLTPIVFYDQTAPNINDKDHEFLCGSQILVCPVVVEKATSRKVYLPNGEWFNFWTDERLKGRNEYDVKCPLDQIPMFVKAGAIVPNYPIQQYVGEKEIKEITLHIYYKNGIETSELYEDDKDTFAYENGAYRLSQFKLTGADSRLNIEQHIEGDFTPSFNKYLLEFHGFPFTVNEVIVDGKKVNVKDGVDANFGKLEVV